MFYIFIFMIASEKDDSLFGVGLEVINIDL
jgi:hypothetical protein